MFPTPESFLSKHEKPPDVVWMPIRYVTLRFRDWHAQVQSVTEIAPKSPILRLNRIPIWYGSRAGVTVIWQSVFKHYARDWRALWDMILLVVTSVKITTSYKFLHWKFSSMQIAWKLRRTKSPSESFFSCHDMPILC